MEDCVRLECTTPYGRPSDEGVQSGLLFVLCTLYAQAYLWGFLTWPHRRLYNRHVRIESLIPMWNCHYIRPNMAPHSILLPWGIFHYNTLAQNLEVVLSTSQSTTRSISSSIIGKTSPPGQKWHPRCGAIFGPWLGLFDRILTCLLWYSPCGNSTGLLLKKRQSTMSSNRQHK